MEKHLRNNLISTHEGVKFVNKESSDGKIFFIFASLTIRREGSMMVDDY